MTLNIKSFYPIFQVFASSAKYRVVAIQTSQDQSNVFDPKRPVYKPAKKKNAKIKDQLNILK